MRKPVISLLLAALLLSPLFPAAAAEIRISAAASLTNVVKALVADYQQEHPASRPLPNFAASGALAKQIVAGAPADIYVAADPNWLDYLQQQGLLAADSRKTLAQNSLVLVGTTEVEMAGNRLIMAKDVRQALLYADRGEVDAALVYRTDALLVQQAKLLLAVPQELYPQIRYPAVLTKAGAVKPEARTFFDYLFSPAAQQVFRQHGFVLP